MMNEKGDKFSGIIKNGDWGKRLSEKEVIKVLKQKYKSFDNRKLQLVMPNVNLDSITN